jgi:hypothetical protein
MKTISSLFLLISLLITTNCHEPKKIKGFDSEHWKADKDGCAGERKKMEEILYNLKDQLKGDSEADILDVFGKPEKTLLYKRNQKYFYYFIKNSANCGGKKENDSIPTILSIRLSALNQVSEVEIKALDEQE